MKWTKDEVDPDWSHESWTCDLGWFSLIVELVDGECTWYGGGNFEKEKTVPKAKKAAEQQAIEMFRELGDALGYEVE